MLALAEVHVDQAPVAADAVLRVHDRVADVELGQVLDQRLDVADLLLLLAPARRRAGGEQLGFGDEVDAFLEPREAGVQRRGGDAELLVAGPELLERIERRRAPGGWRAGSRSRLSRRPSLSASISTRLRRVAQVLLAGSASGSSAPRTDGHVGGSGVEFDVGRSSRPALQRQLRMVVGAAVELLGGQEQRFGRQRGRSGSPCTSR